MIKLTKIFDLLGNDTRITIFEGETKLYSGTCGKCTRDIWTNAYIKKMVFDIHRERYIITIRYM